MGDVSSNVYAAIFIRITDNVTSYPSDPRIPDKEVGHETHASAARTPQNGRLPSTLRASNWKCDLPRSEQDAIENAKDYAGLLGRDHWVAHRAGAQDFNSAVSVCREAIVVEC